METARRKAASSAIPQVCSSVPFGPCSFRFTATPSQGEWSGAARQVTMGQSRGLSSLAAHNAPTGSGKVTGVPAPSVRPGTVQARRALKGWPPRADHADGQGGGKAEALGGADHERGVTDRITEGQVAAYHYWDTGGTGFVDVRFRLLRDVGHGQGIPSVHGRDRFDPLGSRTAPEKADLHVRLSQKDARHPACQDTAQVEDDPAGHRSLGTGTQVPRSARGLTTGVRRVTSRKITAIPASTKRVLNFIAQSLEGPLVSEGSGSSVPTTRLDSRSI